MLDFKLLHLHSYFTFYNFLFTFHILHFSFDDLDFRFNIFILHFTFYILHFYILGTSIDTDNITDGFRGCMQSEKGETEWLNIIVCNSTSKNFQ